MAIAISQFIDIHVHILPGIDDGPKNLHESAEIAQLYMDAGIKQIIATPHFIPGTAWAAGREKILSKLEELQKYLAQKKIELEIFPGMEIAYHQKLTSRLEKGMLQPLAGSKTYLLEPSFNDSFGDLLSCTRLLMEKGLGVILAHPERIPAFQENAEPLIKLVTQGLQVQLNIGSVLGKFGKSSEKMAMHLLAEKSVHYLASDAHSSSKRQPPCRSDWETLAAKLGEKLLAQLCVTNPRSLLN